MCSFLVLAPLVKFSVHDKHSSLWSGDSDVSGWVCCIKLHVEVFRHICQLFRVVVAMYLMLTLVTGLVLSVLHALWNYILNTHDYNSANLGSVYSTTCWNQLLPALSLETPDTDSKFLFFFMSAVLGPPVSTFPLPDDRVIESQSWEWPLRSQNAVVFGLCPLVF